MILAVFLAYNANNGLPFVPTYRLSVQVPNANTLVKGNDVRIGGVRVGLVEKIEPVQDPETGAVYAKVDLKLDKSAEPLPKDSTVVVRSRSALGLKYLEIDKGTSSEGYAEGSTLPASGSPTQSRSRSTSSSTSSTRPRGQGHPAATWSPSATRWPAAART